MKRMIITLFILSGLYSLPSAAELNEQETAQTLFHNVAMLDVRRKNGENHHGFGWIIGNENGKLYIVTANHVVRGDFPDEVAEEIEVRFYQDSNSPHEAELLQTTSENGLDLAIIRIDIPARRPWLYSSMGDESVEIDTPVSFVGMDKDWKIPDQLGRIQQVSSPQKKYNLMATGLPVGVGTSGAPLISRDGIVGMIVTDSEEGTGIISLAAIKNIVMNVWNYPWGLKATSEPILLDGVWAPKTANIPKNIRLTFTPTDSAHFEYSVYFPSNPRSNDGIGVVDGDEIRIWQSLSGGKNSHGTFSIFPANNVNPLLGMLMNGFISDGDTPRTQMRLAKLLGSNDSDVDPRAQDLMKEHPSQIEILAKDLLSAEEYNGTSEEGIPLGLDQVDTNLLNGGFFLGKDLLGATKKLIKIGALNVNLSIKNKCFVASGNVVSKLQLQKVDDVLTTVVQEVTNKFGEEYSACNEVKVMPPGTTVSISGSMPFDFAAELAKSQLLLEAMLPDVKLSVQGECLEASGKVQALIQKTILIVMLEDLARELSKKSNSEIIACDKTTI